jgi:hypothetical protein
MVALLLHRIATKQAARRLQVEAAYPEFELEGGPSSFWAGVGWVWLAAGPKRRRTTLQLELPPHPASTPLESLGLPVRYYVATRRKLRTLSVTRTTLIATSASTCGKSSTGPASRSTTPRMISIMCVAGSKRPIV